MNEEQIDDLWKATIIIGQVLERNNINEEDRSELDSVLGIIMRSFGDDMQRGNEVL